MLSFFSKKNYLADHIGGITDFHNHLLPGIDDGADSMNDSIEMLDHFKEIGINKFIVTPHIIKDLYNNSSKEIVDLKNELQSQAGNSVRLEASAEYMMDQGFMDLIDSDDILKMPGGFVLVEMSYFQAPINLNQILFQLQNKSYLPILAHPERYPYNYSPDLSKYHELKKLGCKFQLNLLSLTPHYGKHIQKIAFKLIEAGLIDFVGTDAHRVDHIEKIKTITLPKKNLNEIVRILENTKKQISID